MARSNSKRSRAKNKTTDVKEQTTVDTQPVHEEAKVENVKPVENKEKVNETKTEVKEETSKPKTFSQKLGSCKTFECLYEEFKNDPEYSKVVLPLNTYVNFIRGNKDKSEQNYVRYNYDLYVTIKTLLSNKDHNKASNYLKLINRAFVLASDVFKELHLLAYDYRWNGTDKSRREWLALGTLLLELSNPKRRKEVIKFIDFNKGLNDINPAIADNLRKFYAVQ